MSGRIILVVAFLYSTAFGFVIEPESYSDTRIVGGDDAVNGQFPWMISLRLREGNAHQCGGSILNSKWILTAAHCFAFNDGPEDHIVVAGSVLLSSGGVVYDVARIISHEDFDNRTVKNDVAVIELAKEIEFTELIQPIELNIEFVEEVDSVLSGWGRLSPDGIAPDHLQFMHRRTMTLDDCRQYPTFYPDMLYISDDEICTMSVLEELGMCNGDSGGPLVADGKQIGIVSWGNPGCAFEEKPDVYARVSSFVEWINEAIST